MKYGESTSVEVERIATQIVDACFGVYTRLGPGLLESACLICLYHELAKRGLRVEKEVAMPILYDNVQLATGYRIDLLVEGQIIIELKAVETMNPIFKPRLLTYLKLANLNLGFLVNFNVDYIKDGIERVIRSHSRSASHPS
jgi:GxxExxY protein